jgi:hypothetical protein
MALLAVGMVYLPTSLISKPPTPARRSVTLDSAVGQIGFAIANALGEHNQGQNVNGRGMGMTQEEKNRMLLEAYGERSSLEDMERAFGLVHMGSDGGQQQGVVDMKERNRRLLEAYGEKGSLRDLERAMEIYEVQ